MNKLSNYGCLLDIVATREDRLRDLELFARYIAEIERSRCELEALRARAKFMPDTTQKAYVELDKLAQKIRHGSEFEDIDI